MPTLTTKWDTFGTSVFTRMSQLANRHGAINLAQGFPDFDGPEEIKRAAIAAIEAGANQYAPSAGLPELREAIARRRASTCNMSYDPDQEVTIFSGATEAVYCAFQAYFEPGSEVLALAPFYDSYPAAARAAGLTLRGVPLTPHTFRLDVAALKAAVTPATRAIIVNSPHNPSGTVLRREELAAIAELATGHDLLVMTDEVYEELVFSPAEHISLATLPGMRERTVVISSTSKTFSLTGWKIGYTFAPPELTSRLRTVHQFTVFCSATPLQRGMLAAYDLTDGYYSAFRDGYLERRDALVRGLNASGFRVTAPEGTYFALADYSELSDLDDESFAEWMTKEVGVCCLPISPFYNDPAAVSATSRYVRFGFCKSLATIETAMGKLESLQHQI